MLIQVTILLAVLRRIWLLAPCSALAIAMITIDPISTLDTIQDFLIKLGIKTHMHLWEISISSLNNDTVRPTKIMNSADKNWVHF
jgi:hypothetical protein